MKKAQKKLISALTVGASIATVIAPAATAFAATAQDDAAVVSLIATAKATGSFVDFQNAYAAIVQLTDKHPKYYEYLAEIDPIGKKVLTPEVQAVINAMNAYGTKADKDLGNFWAAYGTITKSGLSAKDVAYLQADLDGWGKTAAVFSTDAVAATDAINTAWTSPTPANIATATTVANAVKNTGSRAWCLDQVNQVIATEAVKKAETSGLVADVQAANNAIAKVTDADAKAYLTGRVSVVASKSDANLSAINIDKAVLGAAFSPSVVSYNSLVGNSVSSVNITPVAEQAGARVLVNGFVLTQGASRAVNLNVGNNVVTIQVQAEDGTTTKTYTVTINRAAVNATDALPVANAGLTLGIGGLSFTQATTSYDLYVANATASTTVTGVFGSGTVTVNGTPLVTNTASSPIALSEGNNVLTVVVTAADNVTSRTYTVNIHRASSSATATATLSGLTINNGTLAPVFDVATHTYSVPVAHNVATLAVAPTLTDAGARITSVAYNGGTAITPVNGIYTATLVDGSANVVINTIAADNTTTSTYTIQVTRAAVNATDALPMVDGGLTLSAGTFNFTQANTSYDVYVPNSIPSIQATGTFGSGSVTVNGTPLVSGTASAAIPLAVGNTAVTVVATAADGVTARTYTVNIHRASGLASAVSTLSGLALNNGTIAPAFAAATTTYSVPVAHSVSTLAVTPTLTDAGARITSVTYNGGTAIAPVNGVYTATLVDGTHDVVVTTVAADNSTASTYTIHVNRAAVNATDALPMADGGLVLDAGTFNFTKANTSYDVYVPNATSSIHATGTFGSGSVTVNGTALATTIQSAAIPLVVGNNTLTVVATAEDGVTTRTYTVIVHRASGLASSVSTLSGLAIDNGTLGPVFAAGTTTYSVPVAHSVSTLSVTPSLTNAGARITSVTYNGTAITPVNGVYTATLVDGSANFVVNTIAADNSTTSTYTISVNRAALGASSALPIANAGLTISAGTLGFTQATTSYDVYVPNTTNATTVTGTFLSGSVTVNGTPLVSGTASASIPLVVGDNAVTVVATAADGVTTKTYTVNIHRASGLASTVDTLSGLTVDLGAYSPVFSSTTYTYSINPTADVDTVRITPTVTDANSRVTSVACTGATVTYANGVYTISGLNATTINDIRITVTAADNLTTQTYDLNVDNQ